MCRENITPILLPSRSPELKPSRERLAISARQLALEPRLRTYDDIIDAACDAWRRLIAQPQTITSIGMRDWAHIGQHHDLCIRLLGLVHHRLRLLVFRCGPAESAAGQTRDLPVPAQRASIHARVFDHAGRVGARNNAAVHVAFRENEHVAPETFKLSRLYGWPKRSPADASSSPSRMPTHGSGPMRIATPSLQWTCTTLLFAGFYRHTEILEICT